MTKRILCFVSCFVFSLTAVAQVQNGQLTGDVTDPSGAAVPNAQVQVTRAATDFTVSATTNQQGHFVVNQLPVGTYVVTVTAGGFRVESHSGMVVNAGSTSLKRS